jgi:uncharacterized membrane protein YhaH (DUF805 family)
MDDDLMMFEQFGVSLGPLLLQVLVFCAVVFTLIRAVRVTLSRGHGAEVPLWLLVEFFIPVLGPILALVYFSRQRAAS